MSGQLDPIALMKTINELEYKISALATIQTGGIWSAYTPVVSGSGGSAGAYAQTVTYSKYMVVGRSVAWNMYLTITNIGSWTGIIIVAPPIAAAVDNGMYSAFYGTSQPTKGFATSISGNFEGRAVLGTSTLDFGGSGIVNGDRIVFNLVYEI